MSRGKQRLLLELELAKVEAEVFGGDEMLQILTGKLTIDEVTGTTSAARRCRSPSACDQKAWKPFLSKAAPAALWPPLKEALVALQSRGRPSGFS